MPGELVSRCGVPPLAGTRYRSVLPPVAIEKRIQRPSGEKILTNGWHDEGPSWAPNGRVLMFLRQSQGSSGKADLWSVDLTGVNERKVPTPLDGSDPSWGPLRP